MTVLGSVTSDGSQSLPAEEGEVLALLERHVVVGVPEVLGVDVATQVLLHDRLELEGQRISYRFLCHESKCNPSSHVF